MPKVSLDYPVLDRLADQLKTCTKCGFCMTACPVYAEEKTESSVARGKLMLVRGLLAGDIDLTGELSEKLNRCTLCGTCRANCPAGTNVPALITAARAELTARRGISFPFNLVYRFLLPRRRLFGWTLRLASWFQGIFLPKTKGTIRHLSFFLSALGKGRHIPRIAHRFLRGSVPEVNTPPAGTRTIARVGYFTGCMTDYVFPESGRNLIRFLNRHGIEVVVPRAQGCCGAPVFLGAGDFPTGRKFADNNLKAFADVDCIITDCATCASAMKEYPGLLADTPERQREYAAFADKVHDITEYLVDGVKLPPEAYRVKPEFRGKSVTWHEPCHLGRYLGVKEQPRKILRSSPDISYVEMNEADRCCGMAGAFSVYYYDIAKKIADRKAGNIMASGADLVVTDCPGCEVQLIDATTRNHAPQRVLHIMELFE